MSFTWIKRYLPKSLFGRAVLILLVPIVFLQLFVAAIFIQRHFDGVTRQMATGVARELVVIVERVETSGKIDLETEKIARALHLTLAHDPTATPQQFFRRAWYDLSGRVIQQVLQNNIDRPISVDLVENWREVQLGIATQAGVLKVALPRGRLSASNPHQLLVLMIAASVFLTIISLIFLRNQVKPIARLASAAEAFGKGRSEPYRPSGAEEVRRAGTAFLAMRQRIERQIDQRTMMLSGVSHDLRTPLTRIKLALATAQDLDDLDEINHDLLEMEQMLNDFLDFSRDTTRDETEDGDAVDLVETIVTEAKRDGKSVTLTIVDNQETPVLAMRRRVLHRAVQNLIENAKRYGTRVNVTLILHARSVVFQIDDDGPGIAPEKRIEAVKPFVRLDAARNQDHGAGTGLGLSIAMDAARSHGGALTLDNAPVLGGLRASLTIPR